VQYFIHPIVSVFNPVINKEVSIMAAWSFLHNNQRYQMQMNGRIDLISFSTDYAALSDSLVDKTHLQLMANEFLAQKISTFLDSLSEEQGVYVCIFLWIGFASLCIPECLCTCVPAYLCACVPDYLHAFFAILMVYIQLRYPKRCHCPLRICHPRSSIVNQAR
jgi:hypothetical protein